MLLTVPVPVSGARITQYTTIISNMPIFWSFLWIVILSDVQYM